MRQRLANSSKQRLQTVIAARGLDKNVRYCYILILGHLGIR